VRGAGYSFEARWVPPFGPRGAISTGRKSKLQRGILPLHPSQPRYMGAAWCRPCWEPIRLPGSKGHIPKGSAKRLCHSSYVALCAWSCRSLLVRTRCAFNSVRFEPVRWLRIAYPAGELLPGWLSAQGRGGGPIIDVMIFHVMIVSSADGPPIPLVTCAHWSRPGPGLVPHWPCTGPALAPHWPRTGLARAMEGQAARPCGRRRMGVSSCGSLGAALSSRRHEACCRVRRHI